MHGAAGRVVALCQEIGFKSLARVKKFQGSPPGARSLSEQSSSLAFVPSPGSSHSLPTHQQQWFLSSRYPRMASGDTGSNDSVTAAGKLQHAPFLADPAELIASVEAFIFDCDGVIWKSNKLMDRVGETIDLLRALGKRIYFLTNNSTKSRKQYSKKCASLGLNVREEEIFSSGFAAVEYLKSIQFPANKKVYVISEAGVQNELEEAGIQWFGGPEDDDKKIDCEYGKLMEHDHDVGAVVTGFDRHLNYYKIQYATLCIRQNPGCLFVASNLDDVVHLNGIQEWAGEGSIVAAIQGSTSREPIVAGKPSTFMMEYLAEKFNITKTQICMVGDKLDTDILFGQNAGCKTLLVLCGVTDLKTLRSPENGIIPDYYTYQVSDLLAAKLVST